MKPDMTSQAITRRIRAASELRDLCLELGKARPLVVKEEPTIYAPKTNRYVTHNISDIRPYDLKTVEGIQISPPKNEKVDLLSFIEELKKSVVMI